MTLTSHNIKNILKTIKAILKPFNNEVESIDEFPFKELFSYTLIRNRNHIELNIDVFQSGANKKVYSFPKLSTTYYIRKTPHQTESRVCII